MATVRKWFRSLPPETVILAGAVVAFGGNYGLLAWTVLIVPPEEWPVPLVTASLGLALSILMPLAVARRRARTAKHFGVVGLLASAIALLTLPGAVGGGVALFGAVWGILATDEGM